MPIGAIIALGVPGSVEYGSTSGHLDQAENLAGNPIACFEVMGKPIFHHMIAWLRRSGIGSISVVLGESLSLGAMPVELIETANVVPSQPDWWSAVEEQAEEYRNAGIENILLIRMGAYAEFNISDLLRFHHTSGRRVTRVHGNDGALDVWMIDCRRPQRAQVPTRRLLRGSSPQSATYYILRGYINRLRNAWDLRRLAVDSFLSRCSIAPAGNEVKAGVWVDEEAQVHHRARLVAPVYIGRGVKVRDGALITRFSHVEENCRIDCGTVVDNASILANTYVGQWLDLASTVVSGSQLVHLGREVEVEVHDQKLISAVGFAPRRAVEEKTVLNQLWTWAVAGLGAAGTQKSAA